MERRAADNLTGQVDTLSGGGTQTATYPGALGYGLSHSELLGQPQPVEDSTSLPAADHQRTGHVYLRFAGSESPVHRGRRCLQCVVDSGGTAGRSGGTPYYQTFKSALRGCLFVAVRRRVQRFRLQCARTPQRRRAFWRLQCHVLRQPGSRGPEHRLQAAATLPDHGTHAKRYSRQRRAGADQRQFACSTFQFCRRGFGLEPVMARR